MPWAIHNEVSDEVEDRASVERHAIGCFLHHHLLLVNCLMMRMQSRTNHRPKQSRVPLVKGATLTQRRHSKNTCPIPKHRHQLYKRSLSRQAFMIYCRL